MWPARVTKLAETKPNRGQSPAADFGYVGSAPNKINLYVGKKPVKFNIPEAVERLGDLMKEHGKWVEAEAHH